ncbi:MAG: 50S ribosomal protein L3 [Alphaproteobacteria bacterium]|nr:50S ribosomal protein L3 [Alphaproteobacteria bacterium]
MRTGLIAYKMGMTRVFDENNKHVPVTVLKIDNCKVIDVKTMDRDGYTSVQLGAGLRKESKISKSLKGHLAKSGALSREIREFRVSEDCLLNIGDEILPSHFVKGQFVDVSGRTIGKGYAGGMKRWNFRGLEDSHGVSVSHRSVGSTGQCQDPGRVFKGKKMPGHLGDVNVTVQNLVVVDTDDENGYILVRGAVPGATGSVVCIYDAVKRALPADAPVPASLKKSAKVEAPAEEKVETTAETVESKE